MAPVNIMARLKSLYSKHYDEPVISVQAAACFSILLTLIYVVPFYVSTTTRPSPTLSRDAPSVIRARIRAVTSSCVISTLAVFWLIIAKDNAPVSEALRLLGWWPVGLLEIARSLALTAILFTGPLFERGIAEGEWRDWIRGRRVSETLRGWIGWRNYVAVSWFHGPGIGSLSTNGEIQGPITEEIMFRSAIVPLHVLARVSPGHIVFMAPLYFGIAHVHHFYEFRLTHPDTSIIAAMFRSIFQFSYTTIFGWYATFIYLRTGSLPAAILAHTFCNWCGLPRLWGRVEAVLPIDPPLVKGKENPDRHILHEYTQLGVGWSVAYYALLVGGAVGFYYALWPLTISNNALVSFTPR